MARTPSNILEQTDATLLVERKDSEAIVDSKRVGEFDVDDESPLLNLRKEETTTFTQVIS